MTPSPEENLNIEHHSKILLLKALNNSITIIGASYQLKVSIRTVYRMMDKYKVKKGHNGYHINN